ncbi:MAG: carbohydrate binding family 9 domain-containing protein [Holophagaceae bacterium]|nr:carbohydrate binding family 9 domain-containing protein [Holophagaceae bacterium]
MKFVARLFLACSFCFGVVSADDTGKELRTRRLTGTIKVDGKLDEPDWQNLPVATGFVQDWPDLGRPATLQTEVKVLYDDRNIYVGARMHHTPGKANIIKRIHRRDQASSSDWFGVHIDSLLDRSTAFGFFVNAGGVQRDEMKYNDTSTDTSWDGVWESAVSIDEDGWTAEIKIPLTLLRIRPGGGAQTWGINFYREDQGAIREYTRWEWVPRGQSAFVSRFPLLVGIEGLEPHLRREWIPYLSAQRKFETAEERYDDRKWNNRIGLDAHIGVTTTSQLDLTIWPDFGQVEVDQAVINLGTTETFFTEKRPFFIEGMDIFRVIGQDLVYSRRIGTGIYVPSPDTNEILLDAPRATDIGLAAKYTAKLPMGLNIGVLGASVEPARADLLDAEGSKFEREIYPMTNFGVLRVQQLLDKRGSYIGGFASYMRQAKNTGREAQTYALDGIYKSPDRSNTIQASIARTDAGYRHRDSEDGWRAYLVADQRWNNGLSIGLTAVNAGKSFDPNDVGYLSRADEQRISLSISKHQDHRWWVIRNYSPSFGLSVSRDQAGKITGNSMSTGFMANFMNFWYLRSEGGVNFSAYDDRELRTFREPTKKYLKTVDSPYLTVYADTSMNKPYYLSLSLARAWYEGGPNDDINLNQTIKPHSAFEIQFGTGYTKSEGGRRYMETLQGTPITGLRRLSQFNQTLRISYAIDPNLTIQFFSQWLAGAWNYRDFKQYVDDDTLADWTNPTYRADSARNWTLNLISRWEFRPGSTAYLVYTHGASTNQLINQNASLSPWNDLSILKHLPSDDVVQLKISWLFR